MFDPLVSDIDTLTGIRGKNLISEMDTLYLINAIGVKEFVRCAGELERCRQLSIPAEDLETNLARLQEGMKAVDNNILSFKESALKLQQENDRTIQELMKENKILGNNLQTLQIQLEQTREALKAERWNSMSSKLLWGAGGFTVGTILMAIIVTMVK
jgi:hypothetical protein